MDPINRFFHIKNRRMFGLPPGWLAASVLMVLCCTTSMATAATATVTTTFRPGFFWSDFVYNWTITAAPADIPFNDFEIQMASLASLNTGSYTGPGAVQNPPAGQPNLFRVVTAAPGGFGNPVTFSIRSVANPNVVEGFPKFDLTLGGAIIGGAGGVAKPPAPARPVMPRPAMGALQVSFVPGTFGNGALVDLFQSTAAPNQTSHIGSGQALGDGSALISLLRSLEASDLFVGETADGSNANGVIIGALAPVPVPAAFLLLSSSLLALGFLRRRAVG